MKKTTLIGVILSLVMVLALSACATAENENGVIEIEEGTPLALFLASYQEIINAGSYLVETTFTTSMTLNDMEMNNSSHALIAGAMNEKEINLHIMSWTSARGIENLVTSYFTDGHYFTDMGGLKTKRIAETEALANYNFFILPNIPYEAVISQDTEDWEDDEDEGLLLVFVIEGSDFAENVNIDFMPNLSFNMSNFDMRDISRFTQNIDRDSIRENFRNRDGGNLPNIDITNLPNLNISDLSDFNRANLADVDINIEHSEVIVRVLIDTEGSLLCIWVELKFEVEMMEQTVPVQLTYTYDFLRIGGINIVFPDDLEDYELIEQEIIQD